MSDTWLAPVTAPASAERARTHLKRSVRRPRSEVYLYGKIIHVMQTRSNVHRRLQKDATRQGMRRAKAQAAPLPRSPPIRILRLRRLGLRVALRLLRRLCCRLLLGCLQLLHLVRAILLADGLARLDLGHFLLIDALLAQPVRGARRPALAVGVQRTQRRPPLSATGKAAMALVSSNSLAATHWHRQAATHWHRGVRTFPSAFPAPPGLTFEALGAPRPAGCTVEPGKTPLLLMLYLPRCGREVEMRAAALSTGCAANCGSGTTRPCVTAMNAKKATIRFWQL